MRDSDNRYSSNKLIIAILCICVAVATIGVGIYVAYVNGLPGIDAIVDNFNNKKDNKEIIEYEQKNNSDNKEEMISSESETNIISFESVTDVEIENVTYSFPERMMAVTMSAGVDYAIDSTMSNEEIKKSVSDSIADAKSLTANSLFLSLSCNDDTVLFPSNNKQQKKISIDIIKYAIDEANRENLNVYLIYSVNDNYSGSPALMTSSMEEDLALISQYDIDGIIIDAYELYSSPELYEDYLNYGSGMGFDRYLSCISEKMVTNARKIIFRENPKISVGLTLESVWANSDTDESGTATEAVNESLTYGHSDTKLYIKDKNYDFSIVKAYYSTTNKKTKFSEYISWWDDIIGDEMPMYLYQYASMACTDKTGWDDPSELSDQVIAAEKTSSFEGSIFDSVSALKKNPKQSTDALIKYLTENVDPSFLLTQLEMTKPSKTTFSTYEAVVTFAGASDINFDLFMNGEKINRDANGAFMQTIDLVPGLNTFTFTHKEKTITYNITRNVQVLKEISPMGNVTANGGMSITVSAIAYENSVVTATLGGTTVTLNQSSVEDDSTDNESTYKLYSGTITVPSATSEDQDLGNIVINGKWSESFKETMTGANVTVAARATSGSLIEVVADAAETFPTDTLNDLSDYDCYPLAKGTRDYTVGDEMTYVEGSNTYSYYMLESGQRVYSKDVKTVSGDLGGNIISEITVSSNQRYTYVSLEMSQHASYVAKYSSSAFTIDFKYTDNVPKDMELEYNPLFDSAEWNGTCLNLEFSTSSGFLGYYAYYEDDTLVFRFNNPTGSYNLSGVPIVVDVGHSALGVGALGYLSAYGEYEINLAVCQKLKSELENLDATVYMMDTENSRPSLEDRTAYAFSKNPLLFVSIHCNSSSTNSGDGTECFYFTRFSSAYASMFSDVVSSALETSNRGARLGRYYVTRVHEYPSVLGEIGFVSNESDYYKMISASYQYDVAERIADSISSYMGSVGRNGNYEYGTQSSTIDAD